MALGAAPDGEPPVPVPPGSGAVGLYVPLMHRPSAKFPLDDDVRRFESLSNVAHLVNKMAGYIGGGGVIALLAVRAYGRSDDVGEGFVG